MADALLSKVSRGAILLCALLAGLYGISFVWVAFASLGYPYNLEWMEGHSIEIIQRLRDGLPIYTKPSLEFIPYIYTPFYFYVSAWVSWLTGVGFVPARLVSILSTLGTAYLAYQWMRKEGAAHAFGIIASGLFLGTYGLSSRWFDVARIDSLYLLLMVWGLYVYYFGQTNRSSYMAGLLFALAFLTKQSALVALAPAFLAALWLDKNRAFKAGFTAFWASLIACAFFEWQSAGWFWFFIYDVPAGHSYDMRMLSGFWLRDIKEVMFMALPALALMFYFYRHDRHRLVWYGACVIGFIASAYLSRLHSFGWMNVLMPAHFILALCAGLALAKLPSISSRYGALLAALVLGQFLSMYYDPRRFIPTEEAEAKGRAFLQEIANIAGDVLFVETQYIQTIAGKKNYSFGMAGFDIARSDLGKKNIIKEAFIDDMRRAIESQQFSAVVAGNFIKLRELRGYYELERTIDHPQEFVTGAVNTPKAALLRPVRK